VRVRGVVESHAGALSIDPRPVVAPLSSVMIAVRSSRRARRIVAILCAFVFRAGPRAADAMRGTTTDGDVARRSIDVRATTRPSSRCGARLGKKTRRDALDDARERRSDPSEAGDI